MAIVGEQTDSSANAARSRGSHASSHKSRSRTWPTWLAPALSTTAIAGTAWLVRAIGITRNYDIFIDEITYTRVADNLANGHGLVLYGTPFDLHPPAAFALYALAIKIFGLHGSIASILFSLRPFVALLGSSTCAIIFLLVRAVAGWRAGAVAAVVIALDPFQIYYDSRVMLEAPAQLASTLAIFLLVMSLRPGTTRRQWILLIIGGISAGCAICTKEYFGLVLGLTLLVSLATGWITERRKAAVALTVMGCCYALSELLVAASTGFQAWWDQSTSGLRRLIGSEQTSGFNSSTVHVSLISRLTADASHFGITYLILGFGALAGVLQIVAHLRNRADWSSLAQTPDRGRLLVAIWALAATAYLCYATLFGTLEEQMYYLLFTPSLCTLVLGAEMITPRLAVPWRRIAFLALAVVLVVDSAVWATVHERPDDEYRQLLSWAPKHLPVGSTVAVTEGTAEFLLERVALGQWATIPALIKHHVDYVLLSTDLINQGYGLSKTPFERYLQAHATVVFQATGPSDGALVMYDVRAITGARI